MSDLKALKTEAIETTEGDLVLQEIWRIKDTLSASYGHDVDRLFAEARKRQEHSGHPVVNRRTQDSWLAENGRLY